MQKCLMQQNEPRCSHVSPFSYEFLRCARKGVQWTVNHTCGVHGLCVGRGVDLQFDAACGGPLLSPRANVLKCAQML